jgi:hypothetical protein
LKIKGNEWGKRERKEPLVEYPKSAKFLTERKCEKDSVRKSKN